MSALLAACCLCPNLLHSEEGGMSSRVGMNTPQSHQESALKPPPLGNPISGYAEKLGESAGMGGNMFMEFPKNVTIDHRGEAIFDTEKQTAIYIGEPVVHMKTDVQLEVFAKRAFVDHKAKTITLTGDLAIFRKDSLSRAERAVYNYDTKDFHTDQVKTKMNGMILRSGDIRQEKDAKGREFIESRNASVTSEDDQDPLTWIRAKRIRMYPDDSVQFSGLTCNYGNFPFFYFPYFNHSLNPDEGYMPLMGASTYLGAFVLNKYGFLLGNRRVESHRPTSDYLLTTHLDYRTRRGFGTGFDFSDVSLKEKFRDMTGLSVYGVHDIDPTISPTDEQRTDVSKDRWRVALQQMWMLPLGDRSQSRWRLKANINALSDAYMLRDFYKDLYQENAQPDNTVALTRTGDTTEFTLLQRFAPNDYYLTDQRMAFTLNRVRTPLFGSRIVYETENSVDFMRQVVPGQIRNEINNQLRNTTLSKTSREFYERLLQTNGFLRIHSFHEFSTSYKVANFLNLTPKVGGGYTGYYDSGSLGSFNQGIFYSGVDADFKFSRKYSSVSNSSWGLNGLNHIIQPHFALAYIGANELDPLCPRIDGYTPTTNPQALTVGQITEIDSLATSSIFRYGVKNFLMTQRDGGSLRWLAWDVFMDAYLHDAANDRKFSNLYSQLEWNPLPWIGFSSGMQFPVLSASNETTGYHEYNNYLTFKPFRSTEFMIGHRYLTGHSTVEDSSQLDCRMLYRMTEELAVGTSWRFDLLKGKADIQEYNIYKNMGAWYLGAGIYMRRNGNRDEVGFGISFMLKETGTFLPVKFY